jgi:MFS family permease
MVSIKGYAGIIIAVGILLIIISGILDDISNYLKLFANGNDGNLVIDFAKSLAFNVLFWIGFIIAIVGYYLSIKPIFDNKEAVELIQKKHGETHKSLFKFFKVYKLAVIILTIFSIIFAMLFLIEFLIGLPLTIFHENEALTSSLKGISVLYSYLPIQTLLMITLIIILIRAFMKNLLWAFDAAFFRDIRPYFFSVISVIALLFVNLAFLAIIFIIFLSTNETLNATNQYLQTFDTSYIDKIQATVSNSLNALIGSIPFILYYLIVWLITGIALYFVYYYRPKEYEKF